MEDRMIVHVVLRRLARWAVFSFFTEIHVIGSENVPKDGPLIVVATHHNMMLDPAILTTTFPYQRMLHYWSKASLFANPVLRFLLYSSGNIPVDRKSKDRQKLFQGTFDALGKGFAVALFPEGTSYTEPCIMQVKDGAAWAALEFAKWATQNPEKAISRDVKIVPVTIVYTEKSKYRSDVIVEYCRPISMADYMEQFMAGEEGARRAAVKRMTRAIEVALTESTVNAPDWDTLYMARMARDLLWPDHRSINLDDFVEVSQTLVDLFSTFDAVPNFHSVQRHLLEYYSLLKSTNLSHSVLSSLPLPRTLDPNTATPLPSRIRTLLLLVRDSLSCLVRLPFFAFPLIVHAPIYVMGRLGASLVEHEEETQAQSKVVVGLLLLFMIYPATFFFLWALFMYTGTGAVLAAATVYLFAIYHVRIINDTYERMKRLLAAWRVLVGVWAPRAWDIPAAALAPYTTPVPPLGSQWIDRPLSKPASPITSAPPSPALAVAPATVSALEALRPTFPRSMSGAPEEPPVGTSNGAASVSSPVKRRRPPSRRMMRHVLRARAEAVRALAGFLAQLAEAPPNKRVRAAPHLARAHRGWVTELGGAGEVHTNGAINGNGIGNSVPILLVPGGGPSSTCDSPLPYEVGYRSAREVLAFLRAHGADLGALGRGVEGEWAAAGTETEGGSDGERGRA